MSLSNFDDSRRGKLKKKPTKTKTKKQTKTACDSIDLLLMHTNTHESKMMASSSWQAPNEETIDELIE